LSLNNIVKLQPLSWKTSL